MKNNIRVERARVRMSQQELAERAEVTRQTIAAIEQGRFRQDLYHRINEFTLEVPPLRNRIGDLEEFVNFFKLLPSIKEHINTIQVSAPSFFIFRL